MEIFVGDGRSWWGSVTEGGKIFMVEAWDEECSHGLLASGFCGCGGGGGVLKTWSWKGATGYDSTFVRLLYGPGDNPGLA